MLLRSDLGKFMQYA